MVDLEAVIDEIGATLIAELDEPFLALYLFGSAARNQYVPGRSDIDLLLVVDPAMPLLSARQVFRSLWQRHADVMGHGPMIATAGDLALHLELFPALHRALRADGILIHGEPILEGLPPPPPPDPLDEIGYIAAHAITRATALTPEALPPEEARRLARNLDRLARRTAELPTAQALTPVEAIVAIQHKLQQQAQTLPQFAWQGAPPGGDAPDLLPGVLAFYQWEKHLIVVLERIDRQTLADVNWTEVGEAAEDAHARFGMATPWQLRLAASQFWPDSLFFHGFEQLWGADILGDLQADEPRLLRQLARVASEQRVETVPIAYCTIEESDISMLIHDTQNVLLNAGLRAELFARLTGRAFDLPDWTPPDRQVPQPERVAATWERWREITDYYVNMWRSV